MGIFAAGIWSQGAAAVSSPKCRPFGGEETGCQPWAARAFRGGVIDGAQGCLSYEA